MNNNFISTKCPQCGGNLKTGIDGVTLFCNYCGFETRINNENQEQDIEKKQRDKDKAEAENGNSSTDRIGMYEAIVVIAALLAGVIIILIQKF